MELAELGSCAAALLSAIALWVNVRDKRFCEIENRFDKIDERFDGINQRFDGINYEISEIRERLAGIEMSTIFLQVNPTPPSRSEIAKKVWERRKAKPLAHKE